MKKLEIECKLDANFPHAFTRVRQFLSALKPRPSFHNLHIQDTYLDHISRDLAAQQIALRVRSTDGAWEATFKTRTEIKNGMAKRWEETWPLPKVCNVTQALAQLALQHEWKGIAVTKLVAQFTLHNKRTIYAVNYKGALLEVALDNVTLNVYGRQLKMKEIEIELKRGKASCLEQFVCTLQQTVPLKTTKISKVKTAEALLKLFAK